MNCTVTGAEKLIDATIAYQWFKDGDMVQGQTMETLFFPALSSADAGGYTCRATVMSSLLSAPITISTTSVLFIDFISTCKSLNLESYMSIYKEHKRSKISPLPSPVSLPYITIVIKQLFSLQFTPSPPHIHTDVHANYKAINFVCSFVNTKLKNSHCHF